MSKSDFESKEKIRALVDQDEKTFSALVQCYHANFELLARQIVADSVAEEVVQEAWIAIYNNLPKFQGRSKLNTWMIRIVSNKAISRRRKEAQLQTTSEFGDGISYANDVFGQGHLCNNLHGDSPDLILTELELRSCIEKIRKALPAQQKDVFTLSDYEGKAVDEVCQILEITSGNLRVLLHRARSTLFSTILRYQQTGEY